MDLLDIPVNLHATADSRRQRADADNLLAQMNQIFEPASVRLVATWREGHAQGTEAHLLGLGAAQPHVLDVFLVASGVQQASSRRTAAMLLPDWAGPGAAARAIASLLEVAETSPKGQPLDAAERIQLRAAVQRMFGGGGRPPLPAPAAGPGGPPLLAGLQAGRPPTPAAAAGPAFPAAASPAFPAAAASPAFPAAASPAFPAAAASPAFPAAAARPAFPAAAAGPQAPQGPPVPAAGAGVPHWMRVAAEKAASPIVVPEMPSSSGQLTIRVQGHLIQAGGIYAASRPRESALRLLEQAGEIWTEQADIHWQVLGVDTLAVDTEQLDRVLAPNAARSATHWPRVAARTLHVYFVRAFPSTGKKTYAFAIAHPSMSAVFVADRSATVFAFVALARHVGKVLGLSIRSAGSGLMVTNSHERTLHPSEVATARASAERFTDDGRIIA